MSELLENSTKMFLHDTYLQFLIFQLLIADDFKLSFFFQRSCRCFVVINLSWNRSRGHMRWYEHCCMCSERKTVYKVLRRVSFRSLSLLWLTNSSRQDDTFDGRFEAAQCGRRGVHTLVMVWIFISEFSSVFGWSCVWWIATLNSVVGGPHV